MSDLETAIAAHRRELYAHCYRMLGSVQDAEDALQDALLGAWSGFATFAGRSSVRTWLYRIATNACLKLATKRGTRWRSYDLVPARSDVDDLGAPLTELFIEPLVADPGEQLERRESVELAFIAALQHLPPPQRAALLLCDVLELSSAEAADTLDTTVAAINSALQRARATIEQRVQRDELAQLDAPAQRELATKLAGAWERADYPAMMSLLAEDVRFAMPPLPAWFDGKDNVGRFLRERVFATPWRLLPRTVNGQLGFACYMGQPDGSFALGAINAIRVRGGQVAEIAGFLDPALYEYFGLAKNLPADR